MEHWLDEGVKRPSGTAQLQLQSLPWLARCHVASQRFLEFRWRWLQPLSRASFALFMHCASCPVLPLPTSAHLQVRGHHTEAELDRLPPPRHSLPRQRRRPAIAFVAAGGPAAKQTLRQLWSWLVIIKDQCSAVCRRKGADAERIKSKSCRVVPGQGALIVAMPPTPAAPRC